MQANWKAVARDVIIIQLFAFLGGFLIGFSGAQDPGKSMAIGLSNIISYVRN